MDATDPPARPKLSPLDATLLVMGGIVGVGIFFNPQEVAARAYEPWAFLSLWLFGGAIALCAALTFAELGASFPRSGGWFVFLREGFGPFPAFLFAWVVLFVVSTGAMAAILLFCTQRLHGALPGWVDAPGTGNHLAVAMGIVLGLTGVTLFGVKRAALLQNACMVIKLVAIAALILAGLLFFEPSAAAPATAAVTTVAGTAQPRGSLAAGMVAALLPVFFSYGGWQMVCYIAPEVRDPERTLPRAIVGGVLGVVAVYLLANLAFLHVLGIEGIASDPGFASTLARASMGPAGERVLSAAMAISALGVCAVNVIVTPWLYVAMARERLFFQRFGRLDARTGVPTLALLVQAGMVLVYLSLSQLRELVDTVVFAEWIFHGLAALALLRLRRLRPGLPRPFRSFAYPLAPLVYLVAALLVVLGTLVQADRSVLTGLGIVLLGALAYRPWRGLVGALDAPAPGA